MLTALVLGITSFRVAVTVGLNQLAVLALCIAFSCSRHSAAVLRVFHLCRSHRSLQNSPILRIVSRSTRLSRSFATTFRSLQFNS